MAAAKQRGQHRSWVCRLFPILKFPLNTVPLIVRKTNPASVYYVQIASIPFFFFFFFLLGVTQQERNALQECWDMPASPPNSLCWNLAKPREECQGRWFRRLPPRRVSPRAPWLKPRKGRGRRWGYGREICLNLAARDLAHRYTTNDIILPWKESWWKFAAGSQLPTGGCHALWLQKYFFHWQIPSPDPLFFFFRL